MLFRSGRAGVFAELLRATGIDAVQRRELSVLSSLPPGEGITGLPRAGQYAHLIRHLERAVDETALRPRRPV